MRLFEKINIKRHKNLIFLGAIACLSLSIRALIASYRYVLSKDDVIYLTVAKNLAMGNGLSFDGIHPHLFFPPFYPIISALGFYFFKDMELVSKLNYILRLLFYWVSRIERLFSFGTIGYFAPNIIVIVEKR